MKEEELKKILKEINLSVRKIGEAAPMVAKLIARINASAMEIGKHTPLYMEKIMNRVPAWARETKKSIKGKAKSLE